MYDQVGEDGDDIETVERRIEALAAEIRRCRKLALAARFLIASGAAGLALLLLGALTYRPEFLIAAMATMIGGVVLLGSNASTWDQNERALREAEALRDGLIAGLPLRLIGEERPTLH